MKAWLCLTCVASAVLVGGCQPSPVKPADDDPPAPPDRLEQVNQPAQDPFEGLDARLAKEIRVWKKGDHPPARLLCFPDGPPAARLVCGLPVFGDRVGDYIGRVNDPDLLKALLFDSRADDTCVRAATRRFLELRGVKQLRETFAERRRTNPGDFERNELATLGQLLMSPYARVHVASLERKDASKEAAEKALTHLQRDLASGATWSRAYEASAEDVFDKERSRKEGGGWRTFLCYRYEGLISPIGFDLLDRRISRDLPSGHVEKLFKAKGAVHRFETADAYWLYYVEAMYE